MIACKFENGKEASLRHVTVGALVFNEKNQVLLVKRAPHLLGGDKYAIPGGFLDRNENTKEGVLRELFEETGLKGNVSFLFRINDNPSRPKEDRQNVDVIYVVKIKDGEFRDNDEVTKIQWFDKKELPDEEEFAFDHRESILLYFRYLEKSFQLPIVD